MSRGKNSLWRHQRLLKVTTETPWTFFSGESVAFAISAGFQMFESFWLCCLWFMARRCPAFCLGQEESGWQLLGLCDLFGDVCEGCVPTYTSLLEGCRKRPAQKMQQSSSLCPHPDIVSRRRVSAPPRWWEAEQRSLAWWHLDPVLWWKNGTSLCLSWSLARLQKHSPPSLSPRSKAGPTGWGTPTSMPGSTSPLTLMGKAKINQERASSSWMSHGQKPMAKDIAGCQQASWAGRKHLELSKHLKVWSCSVGSA